MRGEHISSRRSDLMVHGSSPHAWGTRRRHRGRECGRRFIPTCVGNTTLSREAIKKIPVHPHMRGEHKFETRLTLVKAGSSPHAWGTLILGIGAALVVRFIPTCVGNTSWPGSR